MGLDPLVSAVTGTQAINQAYRMSFMPKDAIAVVSDHGLAPRMQYSAIACMWLEWLMHCEAKAGAGFVHADRLSENLRQQYAKYGRPKTQHNSQDRRPQLPQ